MEASDGQCVAIFDRPILTGGIIGSMLMGTLEGAAVRAAIVGGTGALAADSRPSASRKTA